MLAKQTSKIDNLKKALVLHKIHLTAADSGSILTPNNRSELALIGETKRDDQIFIRKTLLMVHENIRAFFKSKTKSNIE